jgi:hypothetical protein
MPFYEIYGNMIMNSDIHKKLCYISSPDILGSHSSRNGVCVFWDVTVCNLVHRWHYTYRATQYHNPEDNN